jgi:poly-beta-1,6-N-acetyl-D-glucosamine synthase
MITAIQQPPARETNAPPAGRRLAVVTPARNEERFLPSLIKAMVAQKVRPAVWVIVDDGSEDTTAEIAEAASAEHPWIQLVRRSDRGSRKLGGGVVAAFEEGLRAVDLEYDFVGKLDADVTFGPLYLQRLFEVYEQDARLGSASGKVYRPEGEGLVEEFMIDDMVAGQWKTWRRECFSDIGGLVCAVMWDGIDFHRARMFGWRTRSIMQPDLAIHHHRLMGSSDRNVLKGRLRWGAGQWFMGSHPLYVFASSVLRMRERPYVIGGVLITVGYLRAALRREPRYECSDFRRSLRSWQKNRLWRLLSRGEVR